MDELNNNIRRLLRSVSASESGTGVDDELSDECIEDSGISEYCNADSYNMAETITFVICGHKVPYNNEIDGYKFNYELSKDEAKAIESTWANKDDIYNSVRGIMNSCEQKDVPFNIFRYLFNTVPKIGHSKAGLATQMILGSLGCYDHERDSGDERDTATRAFNNFMRMMQDNSKDATYRDIWKNWSKMTQKTKGHLTEGKKVSDLDKNIDFNSISAQNKLGKSKFWGTEVGGFVNSDS